MKKTILALAALASMGMANTAMATDTNVGQAVFQWAGTVPSPSSSEAGYWIVSADGGSILSATDGVMIFDNKAGEIKLKSATTFGFKVVTDKTADGATFNPAEDTAGVAYKATLGGIKAGKGGLTAAGGDDGYFAVTAGGDVLSTSTAKDFIADEVATVSLQPAIIDDAFTAATEGDVWTVQATLALTTTTAAL
ncbi:hypothetical protein [Photobacterium leiognathi]|uniref:hypothetical protein n=1 Tax=Photobacterium leiognathi TaxID=553611 RepID=UPI002738F05D|nr:hypothetical protein [Photobacterium leiognathi]